MNTLFNLTLDGSVNESALNLYVNLEVQADSSLSFTGSCEISLPTADALDIVQNSSSTNSGPDMDMAATAALFENLGLNVSDELDEANDQDSDSEQEYNDEKCHCPACDPELYNGLDLESDDDNVHREALARRISADGGIEGSFMAAMMMAEGEDVMALLHEFGFKPNGEKLALPAQSVEDEEELREKEFEEFIRLIFGDDSKTGFLPLN